MSQAYREKPDDYLKHLRLDRLIDELFGRDLQKDQPSVINLVSSKYGQFSISTEENSRLIRMHLIKQSIGYDLSVAIDKNGTETRNWSKPRRMGEKKDKRSPEIEAPYDLNIRELLLTSSRIEELPQTSPYRINGDDNLRAMRIRDIMSQIKNPLETGRLWSKSGYLMIDFAYKERNPIGYAFMMNDGLISVDFNGKVIGTGYGGYGTYEYKGQKLQEMIALLDQALETLVIPEIYVTQSEKAIPAITGKIRQEIGL